MVTQERQWKTLAGLPGSGAMKALKMSQLLKPCSVLKAPEEGASSLGEAYTTKGLNTYGEMSGSLSLICTMKFFTV